MGKKKDATVKAIEEIQEEARQSFSLRDRLRGKSNRRKTVSIYTDAEVGAVLGYAEDEMLPGGIRAGERVRKGLIGELDALGAEMEATLRLLDNDSAEARETVTAFEERSTQLRAEISEKVKELEQSALVFTIQALPPIVLRDARRKAKLDLDITGKTIPASLEETFALRYQARVLSASVAEWEDRETGEKHGQLTIDQALELADFLPPGQYPRLDDAVRELSYEVQIGNIATDTADF